MKKNQAILKNKISVDSNASLTDYQYSNNSNHIAISDSEGNVMIYEKNGDNYTKTGQFVADDASIWKIQWAHPKYGKTIAIASFKKKVAIFQQRNHQWVQVAYHNLHEGSVNCVCWAPIGYGLKLYAAGSDGKVSILQLKGNGWASSIFTAHSWSVNSLAIESHPLNEQQINDDVYPRIATASKDQSIKIWKYGGDEGESQTGNLFSQAKYTVISTHTPHKQMIRTILWRPTFASRETYQLVSCSQDGTVKIITFNSKGFQSQRVLSEQEHPISRISQSMTGNMIAVSVGSNGQNQEKTYLYHQRDINNWECVNLNQIKEKGKQRVDRSMQ